MNILVENLPTAIEIDGCEYEINSDFRSCLRIILAFEDPELAMIEKQIILLDNLYKERPENLKEAFEKGIRFLNGGKESQEEENTRLYSFEKDSNFIMAAFQQTHGIDLETAEMHWWKFMALFMDMGSETTFSSIVGLRKRLKSGTATKEERALAREINDILELPELDNRTLDERESDEEFIRQIKDARNRRNDLRKQGAA
jgi:hypothetical protein